MIPTLVITRNKFWESLTLTPCIVTKSQHSRIVLGLNKAHASDRCEPWTAILQRLLEHSLRADPSPSLGVIIETTVDDVRREILRMCAHA